MLNIHLQYVSKYAILQISTETVFYPLCILFLNSETIENVEDRITQLFRSRLKKTLVLVKPRF